MKFEISPDEIEIGKKLGRGAFGTVYRGKLHGKDVAIKKLHVTSMDEEAQEDFKAEMMIMRFDFIFFFIHSKS